MIQIGFCDDDPSVLDELHELLGSYRAEHNADIAPTAFQSPFELLAAIEKGARFDILLLDVLMPGENGIEAAREIRQYDSNVKIIFLTSSAEFAVQSYTVGAYFYQLKPIWPESFFRLMDSVIAACSRESSVSLILRCKTGITRVELDKLEYCEVIRRSLLLHKTDGTVLEAAGSSMDKVVKTTVFLKDMNDFAVMNGIYAQYFKEPFPARSAVQVAKLPKDGKVEIEVVAVK